MAVAARLESRSLPWAVRPLANGQDPGVWVSGLKGGRFRAPRGHQRPVCHPLRAEPVAVPSERRHFLIGDPSQVA